MTGSGSLDDFIPAPRSPRRVARRRAQARRRWGIIAGVVVLTVLLVIIVVITVREEGGHRVPAAGPGSESPPKLRTTTTRITKTTDPTSASSPDGAGTPSTTLAGTGAGTGGLEPPGTGPSGTGPSGTGPSGTGGKVTVTEHSGACRFEGDQLLDSGQVLNTTAEEVVAEVEVTWVDSTGELDSSSDLQAVAPGESTEWSVATPISDPPQGLSCRVALI